MDVTVNDISSVKKELLIKVGAEKISQKLEKIYNRLRKKAKLKGFRPGKAPLNIIKRLYREQARLEAMEDLVQEAYSQALTDNDLVPLAQPEIEDLSFPEDESELSFKAVIEIAPRFEIESYEDIELEKHPVEVDESEVEAELEKLRQSVAEYKTIDERPSREGDVLVIDFVGRIDGEEFEGGKAEDFTIEIGSGRFIPELEKQLAGLESGKSYDLEATFPEDYHQPDLAGKTAVFTVTVKSIRERVLPPLDDDLANQISGGEMETLDDLRAKMVEYLTSTKEAEARSKNTEELFAALRDKVDFELPECMIKEEEENAANAMRSRLLSQGLDQEMVVQMLESNRKQLAEDARKTVKNTLILEYLADKEKIESSPDEISAAFQRFIQRSGQNPQEVLERFKGRESQLTGMLQRDVILDKTIDRLLEKVSYRGEAAAAEDKSDSVSQESDKAAE
ncbi:MAG: trigger factor [Deltaproteobacteria bacterium]|nr:trigger factor [Deltaproteobacteria bacterium]